MFGIEARRARIEADARATDAVSQALKTGMTILKNRAPEATIFQIRFTFRKDPASDTPVPNPVMFDAVGQSGNVAGGTADARWNAADMTIVDRVKHARLERAVAAYARKYSRLREHDEIVVAATRLTFVLRHVSIPF